MRSVAGSVGDFDEARTESKSFTATENPQIFRGNRNHFAEEIVELVAPKARGAGHEFCRIRHVRRAFFMHKDGEARIFANHGTGSSGVIEMDVREEQAFEIGNRKAALSESLAERIESGGGSRIDEETVTARFQ